MAKKIIKPNGEWGMGGINPTLLFGILFVVVGAVFYILGFLSSSAGVGASAPAQSPISLEIGGAPDRFNDPYTPPLKNDGVFFPIDSGDIRGVPPSVGTVVGPGGGGNNRAINIQTRGYSAEFTQIGILTRETKKNKEPAENDPKILPLMGRRIMNGRDKYQYYTISNSGMVNTKLPIRKEGRNCIGEYGCDQLYSGDSVFVEGYGDRFKVTVYESELFRYIP